MIIPLTLLATLTACGDEESAKSAPTNAPSAGAEYSDGDAAVEARLSALEASLDASYDEIEALRTELSATNAQLALLQDDVATLDSLDVRDPALDDLLRYVSVDTANDAVIFDGANVYIQSGEGRTDVSNGTGNLILGYDLDDGGDEKSGSHNLVVGDGHTYTSYGGLVAGLDNAVTGAWATVAGGRMNVAEGDYAVVAGGGENTADGWYAVIAGGEGGVANGAYSAITGGRANTATGPYAAVSGGDSNLASGTYSTASGGSGATASAAWAHVP